MPQVADGLAVVSMVYGATVANRPMGPWTGAPPFGMPGTAWEGSACALPSHPSPGVAPGPSIPCGKAKQRAGTGASRSWSAMLDNPSAKWSANGSSAASKRRAIRLPAGKICSGATPGRQGRGCENTLGPTPYRALGEGGCSRPRPGEADRHRRSAGRGPTPSRPATCGIHVPHSFTASPCTSTPTSISHLRIGSGLRPNGAQIRTPARRRECRAEWMWILGDPAARSLSENAPEPAETASEASMEERRLRAPLATPC